jgi:hypothetical protein
VSEKISEEEAFANTYHYFIEALKVLAADADTQCKRMSNYNVAWEIKDDVFRGVGLLSLPGAKGLTSEERDGITGLMTALKEFPASLLIAATTEAANRKAMNHSSWAPLRVHASELLNLLAATTRRNEDFLAGHKS